MTHFLFAHNIVVKSLQRGMDKGSCRGGEEETTTWSTATKDTLEKTFQNHFERSNDNSRQNISFVANSFQKNLFFSENRESMILNNPVIIYTNNISLNIF